MIQLVFATNNLHKLTEIRHLLGDKYKIVSLSEMGINEIIPENQETIEGNAIEKAKYIYNKYQISCFADDTGLEVEYLQGRPGVFSARYAGEGCSSEDNINKLLYDLTGVKNRKARFRTVIAFINEMNKIELFEGIINGYIDENRRGNEGFGYDSVFTPEGYTQSFAEMNISLKNNISHRAIAMLKFVEYLKLH
jgi:XTP/dITP diphosphohydrolase